MPTFSELTVTNDSNNRFHNEYFPQKYHVAVAHIADQLGTDIKGALEACIEAHYDTLFDV